MSIDSRVPALLARGIVVTEGAAVPPPWSAAPVVVIDQDVVDRPMPTVEQLHEAWARRQPHVIELRVDPVAFRRPATLTVVPWELSPGFELGLDRLQFLAWNNNYDGRDTSAEPIWWWARKAGRLGVDLSSGDPAADVVLADGTPAWIDGGPPDDVDPASLGGAALIRSESIEAGRLTVVPEWRPPTADLAPDQLAAVAHRGGPARVIAPAGSGKTRVLTERLRHLLADRGHESSGVLAVAYNRKAQEEMASRTSDVRLDRGRPRIQTLNALGYEILGRRYNRRPTMLEDREVRRRLEPHLPRMQRRLNTDPMAPYLDGLSMIRLGLRSPEEVEVAADAPGLAIAIDPYRDGLRRDGVIDFDEQIVHAVEVLLADGEFRRAEQARHRHLLVDEFQDLTPAHVLLLRILATPALDVFGVGDDDQVIYGHAGASPRFLIDFAELFPGAHEHALEVNYRCPAQVVDAARSVLSYNDDRVAKTITAARNATDGETNSLRVVSHAPDGGASAVVEAVSKLVAEGTTAGDIAILTRTNSLLLAPHVALVDAGVPIRSRLRSDVLNRVGLRAALAWMRIASDPGQISGADLTEVARRPSRGFPRWIDKWLNRCGSGHEVARAATRIDDERVASKMVDLAADIDRLSDMADGASTRGVLAFIRDEIGLGGAMELLDGRPGAEGSSHLDDLDALIQVADIQADPDLFETYLRRALDHLDPGAGGDDTTAQTATTGVTLSTVHRVKGREWPHVIIFGANGGLMPHRLAEDVEEERRVFHVAITRGIETVTVLSDGERPSEFLGELDGTAPRRPRGAKAASRRKLLAAPVPERKDAVDGEDAVVFEELRKWRAGVAKRQGGPAFVVFGDATLKAIARSRPDSLRALAAIKGVGPTKLDNYGDDVLEIVRQFA